MTKPSHTGMYPASYQDILDLLTKDPTRPVILPFSQRNHAKGEQLSFIAYKNAAIREEFDRGKKVYMGNGDTEGTYVPARCRDIRAYITRVRQNESVWELQIWHQDYTPEALQIKAALEHRLAEDRKNEEKSKA